MSLCFEHVRAVSRTRTQLLPTLVFLLLPVAMTSLYKQAYSAFLNEKPRVGFYSVLPAYPLSDIPSSAVLHNRMGRDPHLEQL